MLKYGLLVTVFVLGAWSQTSPQVRTSSIEAGYIPSGFDSNDQVQMVIEGTYRDNCSKPAGTRFTINETNKTIQVSNFEYRYSGLCLDVLVPHDEVVNLGIIQKAGQYQVIQNGGRPLGRLTVTQATKQEADDYLYAPVSQAYARTVNGKLLVTLSGTFSSSCMQMQKIVSNVQSNVVTIQPLAQMKSGPCSTGRFPFEQTTAVEGARTGRYLLHVRSLNGRSTNTLFDVR